MQQRPRKGGCRLAELPEGRLGGVAARTVGGRADLVELLGGAEAKDVEVAEAPAEDENPRRKKAKLA